MRETFERELFARLPDAKRNGGGECLPGILNVSFKGVDNAAFLSVMDLHGVALSAGSACAAASVKPSHVLWRWG